MLLEEIDTQRFIETRVALIEKKLDELVSERPSAPHAKLFEAARYSLLSSGKRLRPLLALTTAEVYNVSVEVALPAVCALELIHTYSLIHDDLPCMDDDDLRRGRPTLHKVVSEGEAVLAGDFLLTYAFQVLAQLPSLTAEQRLALISTLAHLAGGDGMIGGQLVDLIHEGKPLDWATLEFMHDYKTAALLTASLLFGGIMGEAPESDLALLKQAGRQLGLAFQIVDDILDVTGSEEILGKPIGSDREKEKPTAISLLGLEKAKEQAGLLYDQALEAFSSLSRPAPLLSLLARRLVERSF